MIDQFLAHSAGDKPSVPPQTYFRHISNVMLQVEKNFERLVKYYKGNQDNLHKILRAAAIFHDFGKLDPVNQRLLKKGGEKHLPVNHVDSGTALLLQKNLIEASLLVYSHHRGIPSIPEECAKEELFLRDPKIAQITDLNLAEYLASHSMAGLPLIESTIEQPSDWDGIIRRISLSCLVDADFGDTAKNYGKEFPTTHIEPRWQERLNMLDKYVVGLAENSSTSRARNQLRQRIYKACREADVTPSFYACDSPVGTGKTTAVIAHLLKVAIDKNLRHIIVVLPYTNIIKQSVNVYRKALVLPGEKAEEVIAEHHHQADFTAIELRQLATLWQAPIIVTTAVQFFETIASNHPSKVRKLHELPGSGVFIDETHSAIPTHLWPQTWKWLKELASKWACHFVFASGSLPRFWELRDMVDEPEQIPELVGKKLREEAIQQEMARITPVRYKQILDVNGLVDLVLSKQAPRLVIMNTVQSAAVIADEIAKKLYGEKYVIDLKTSQILHLSTALAPIHRENIVKMISQRLNSSGDERKYFTLVATSCIEAGVDFSFCSAFRERAGTANLIQVGGRVRRHNETFQATLIDFKMEAPLINRHPAFILSSQILEKLFDENRFETDSAANLVTEALRRELMNDTGKKHMKLIKKEADMDYPEVDSLYKVIADNTILVIVDQGIIKILESGKKVDPREINRRSVQIWTEKVQKTCAFEIKGFPGLYAIHAEDYDEMFLGYMKRMLPVLKMDATGSVII